MKRSLVKLLGVIESVTNMVTGCLRTTKVAIFVVWDKKGFSKNMENMDSVYNSLKEVGEFKPKSTHISHYLTTEEKHSMTSLTIHRQKTSSNTHHSKTCWVIHCLLKPDQMALRIKALYRTCVFQSSPGEVRGSIYKTITNFSSWFNVDSHLK